MLCVCIGDHISGCSCLGGQEAVDHRGNPGGPTQGRRSQGQGTYVRKSTEWLRQGQKVIERWINTLLIKQS